MRSKKWLLCCLAFGFYYNSMGQTYVGLSANLGNALNFEPRSEGMVRTPSISGKLMIAKQEVFGKDWIIQYGGALGVLGYGLKVIALDTLINSEKSTFLEYSTFYGQFEFLVGRTIPVKNKKIITEIGGGITYYKCLSSVQYDIGVIDDNNNSTNVFFAEIDCSNYSLAGFAKISAQLKLSEMLTVGLEYSHHFGPALSGYYEFYHTIEPSYGSIYLYQREVSFLFLINISKMRQ